MAEFTFPSETDQKTPSSQAGGSEFKFPSDMGSASSADVSTTSDVAQGLGTGVAKGEAGLAATPRAVMDLIRRPVDWAYGQTAGRVENYLTKGTTDAIPASVIASGREDPMPTYRQTLGAVQSVAANPTDPTSWATPAAPLPKPKTGTGQFAEKVGEYIPGTVLGGVGGVGTRLVSAAGAAAGDELAGAPLKGTWAETPARIVGSVIGGAGPGLVGSAVRSALPAVSERAAGNQAATIIRNAASDKDALQVNAAADANSIGPSNTLLPNWNETSAQRFKDQGLFDLEKAVQTRNPSAFVQNEHGTGTAQQNAVGESYINSLKKPGDPSDVSVMFRAQKQAIEDTHDALSAKADALQSQTLASIGGDQSPAVYGRSISNELTPQFNTAQKEAQDAATSIGGADKPNVYGSALRGSAQTAYDTNNSALRDLFDAIPKNVSAPIGPLKQFSQTLYGDMDPALAATVSPAEHAITGAISAFPDNVPFSSARNIDSLITSSMRQELRTSGRTPAYARMAQMKGAWEDAITNSLDQQHAVEQQAVSAGQMAPEDTMAAAMQQRVHDWYAARDANAGANAATGTGGSSSARQTPASGTLGTNLSGRGQSGVSAGDQGLQKFGSDAPPIDQAGLDALAAAKQGTKDFANTFKKGPVGAVLKSDGTSGSYKMIDSAVPSAVFPAGPKGFEAVNAYKAAVGDDAAAADALHNYAASTLRQKALADDGTLNPAGYAKWRSAYDPAFQALPADVQQRFSTAGNARSALDKFGDFTPQMRAHEVPELFFSPGPAGADGVDKLRSLIGQAKADPVLSDYAASIVKEKAVNQDGTVNRAALQSKIIKPFGPALDKFPALKQQLATVDGTSKLLGDVAVSRAQQIKDFQNGVAKKFLGLDDPTEVRDAVGRMIDTNNVTGIRKLMQAVKANPDAQAGLKRAAAEHISNKFLSESSQAGTTGTKDLMRGTFLNSLQDNRAALQQVLSSGQMQGLDMLANGIRSSNLSRDATRIKASPNTAADYIRAMKFEPEKREPLLRKLLEASVAGTEVGGEHGAIAGAALAVGNHLKNALRDAGMRKIYDVVEHAVLDPEFMKALLAQAPMRPGVGSEITLAHQLGRYSMLRVAQGQQAATPSDRTYH